MGTRLLRALFMKNLLMSLSAILMMASCRQKQTFDTGAFIALSGQYGLLSEKEQEIADIMLKSVPNVDIRSAAGACKKVNFRTSTEELNLDRVNPDSNFVYLKFFREQLAQRSEANSKGPIFLPNMDSMKHNYKTFLRVLHEKKDLSPSQYAKITEKLLREPVVYPFVIFEWIETIP